MPVNLNGARSRTPPELLVNKSCTAQPPGFVTSCLPTFLCVSLSVSLSVLRNTVNNQASALLWPRNAEIILQHLQFSFLQSACYVRFDQEVDFIRFLSYNDQCCGSKEYKKCFQISQSSLKLRAFLPGCVKICTEDTFKSLVFSVTTIKPKYRYYHYREAACRMFLHLIIINKFKFSVN